MKTPLSGVCVYRRRRATLPVSKKGRPAVGGAGQLLGLMCLTNGAGLPQFLPPRWNKDELQCKYDEAARQREALLGDSQLISRP
jgi:hypothetical protein